MLKGVSAGERSEDLRVAFLGGGGVKDDPE